MVVYHEPLHWCWVILPVGVISGDQAASRGYICSPIAVTLASRVETTLHMVNCEYDIGGFIPTLCAVVYYHRLEVHRLLEGRLFSICPSVSQSVIWN